MSIICIAGPTAAGKSASVLRLSQVAPIEIINVDSATIYRGMDIGTAKPSADEQKLCPQHLLDIRDPAESYSAADFVHDTERLITEIQARERIPVLVGGTMMYYKALMQGLDDLPSADATLRDELNREAQEKGWPAMHQRLAELDPITAQRLAPNDKQRVQRALEVCILTGQPMSSLLNKKTNTVDQSYRLLSLEPSNRSALHERIEKRFDQMIEMGFVQEVEHLYERQDLHPDLPSIRCVGYRQIWGYLSQEYDLAQARELGIIATRHLAKRQLTWLRSYTDRDIIDCLDPQAPEKLLKKVSSLLP